MTALDPWLGNPFQKMFFSFDDAGLYSTANPILFIVEKCLRDCPWVSLPSLTNQKVTFSVRVLFPLGDCFDDAFDRSLVSPVHRTWWVDTEKINAIEGESNSTTVTINEALALEGVTDNGDFLRPGSMITPKFREREQDIVIRV